MGVSTDGIICYGIKFDEEYGFPWNDDDIDIEDWWRVVSGFAPSVEIYDEQGGYINGTRPDGSVIDRYYEELRKWDKENPLPVQEVNYCSGDYPLYILAIPGTVKRASRGFPEAFRPEELLFPEDARQALIDFCDKYSIDYEDEPQWYLASYWG